jgi:hypothetical protein
VRFRNLFISISAKQAVKAEVENVSEAKAASFTCAICGWMVKSPFGQQDVDEHAAAHNTKHHGKTVRARMSKSELIRLGK